MENQARRNFKVFPTPEELIEANKYEQSCYMKITKKDITNCDSSTSFDSTLLESSISSASLSSSSSELMEDATSPSTTTSSSSSSSSSNGPLYQLSDLIDKLPIKRGLSRYYEGKSESFTSLADVGNLEDLVKRKNPYKKRFKLCRNNNNYYFSSPKSSISKKDCYSRTPFSSSLLVARTCSNNFKASCRPPTISPVQKEF